MTLAVEVCPGPEDAGRRAAAIVADRAGRAIVKRGAFSLALSGGTTAMHVLRPLAEEAVPWERTLVFQVDERVAPAGSRDRNLTGLLAALPTEAHASVRPMPVGEPDLERAAARYGAELPDRLDLVHLGLGIDGHTASLAPGDPVLEIRDRLVALTARYEGHRRMTLTYPALEAACEILWLVTGEEKRGALRRLLGRDDSIPAARIESPAQLVVADTAAAGA